MNDGRHQYRAIRKSIKQLYPEEPRLDYQKHTSPSGTRLARAAPFSRLGNARALCPLCRLECALDVYV